MGIPQNDYYVAVIHKSCIKASALHGTEEKIGVYQPMKGRNHLMLRSTVENELSWDQGGLW